MKMEQSVPKRRHINFRRRGIAQKKAYNEYVVDSSNLWIISNGPVYKILYYIELKQLHMVIVILLYILRYSGRNAKLLWTLERLNESTFLILPDLRKSFVFWKIPLASSVGPSGTSDVYMKMRMGHGGMMLTGENRSGPTRRKTCFTATLSMNLRHTYLMSPCVPPSKHCPPWL